MRHGIDPLVCIVCECLPDNNDATAQLSLNDFCHSMVDSF